MKRILASLMLSALMLTAGSLLNRVAAQYDQYRGDITYQTFYDELSPYGQWIDYPGHGYAWVPDAGPDFQPYSTNGHWVWTDDYEWMWVSDYDWGWAPFHYGRWMDDPYYGWVWIPGYEWSPAWVAWRDGGDYYGWAPLGPSVNISINFNIGTYSPPYNYWVFVPRRYITAPRIWDHYVDRRQNVTIINYTTIINNYYYGDRYGYRTGPRRYDAERYCGRINPVRLRDSYSPGRTFYRNNEVTFYRPSVRQESNRDFAPRRFERYGNDRSGFRNGRIDDNNRNNHNRFDRNDNVRQPDRNDRVDNGRFNRREDNGVPQPQNNDVVRERRFDRTDNPVRQPDRNDRVDDRRFNRPPDQPQRNPYTSPNNNNNGNNDNNRFDRRRADNPPPQQPRVRDYNNNNGGGNGGRPQMQPQRQPDRRNDMPQRQPDRQMERRRDMPQQQPSRSMERRENGGGGGNRGNERGRRF